MSPTLTRVDELQTFADLARRIEIEHDADFRAFVHKARLVLEMTESDIADALSVSRPTYNRWVNGRNTPHPLMRQSCVNRILKLVQRKINVIEPKSSGASFSGSRGGMVAKSF